MIKLKNKIRKEKTLIKLAWQTLASSFALHSSALLYWGTLTKISDLYFNFESVYLWIWTWTTVMSIMNYTYCTCLLNDLSSVSNLTCHHWNICVTASCFSQARARPGHFLIETDDETAVDEPASLNRQGPDDLDEQCLVSCAMIGYLNCLHCKQKSQKDLSFWDFWDL